jgi:threonine/homoserine/homoserine lactone efflux protein
LADALQILLSGVVLGVSIAAPPGPVTALAAQQVVSRSWLSGWLVTLGATSADAVFFVLTYYGVARFVTVEERGVLFILGAFLMLYLAASTVRRARRQGSDAAPGQSEKLSSSRLHRSPFVWGLSVGLTSPYQLGWWIAIGAGMVSEYGGSIAVGFFGGILAWTLIFTAVVHAGVRRYQRLSPVFAYASAALMAGFGLWFLWVGLSTTVF